MNSNSQSRLTTNWRPKCC